MIGMKYIKTFGLTVLLGVLVALVYLLFEQTVHHATAYVWTDLVDTNVTRWLVLPLSVLLGTLYFGLQHWLDPASEKVESHGLGATPKVTVANLVKILLVGFFSLLAGAALGPEAVLVPACIVLGSMLGRWGSGGGSTKLYGILGFVALMASFFNSFLIGVLSLLLVRKQFKTKLTRQIILLGLLASASAALTLLLAGGEGYVRAPVTSHHINLGTLIASVLVFTAGYGGTLAMRYVHDQAERVRKLANEHSWWLHGLIASVGIAMLYLLGGPLVQFTGNESIKPLLQQAEALGLVGLVIIFVVKLAAIAWSKALGYRGGLIFPTVFAASVLVAIASLYLADINITYTLVVAMAGFLAADKQAKILL